MGLVRYIISLIIAFLFSTLGTSMAIALPQTVTDLAFIQAQTAHFSQADQIGFTARAPPSTAGNVAVTGDVTVMHGGAFVTHGVETQWASLNFGADLVAPNTAGGERLFWGSWSDYPKVTRTGPNGAQEYAVIGDRLYSQHAVARMQPSGQRYTSGVPAEGQPNLVGRDQTPSYVNQPGIQNFDGTQPVRGRSISPSYVEDIISNTSPTISPTTGNRSYRSGDVLVVTSSEGRVITIVTGAD